MLRISNWKDLAEPGWWVKRILIGLAIAAIGFGIAKFRSSANKSAAPMPSPAVVPLSEPGDRHVVQFINQNGQPTIVEISATVLSLKSENSSHVILAWKQTEEMQTHELRFGDSPKAIHADTIAIVHPEASTRDSKDAVKLEWRNTQVKALIHLNPNANQ